MCANWYNLRLLAKLSAIPWNIRNVFALIQPRTDRRTLTHAYLLAVSEDAFYIERWTSFKTWSTPIGRSRRAVNDSLHYSELARLYRPCYMDHDSNQYEFNFVQMKTANRRSDEKATGENLSTELLWWNESSFAGQYLKNTRWRLQSTTKLKMSTKS